MTIEARWHSIRVTARPEAVEAVEFVLDEYGSHGIETDHLRKGANDDIAIVGYYDDLPPLAEFRGRLIEVLQNHELSAEVIRAVESAAVEDRDWLAEWKKHWRSTRIGGFIIAPPWEEVEETDAAIIRIEPNMAFGTGTHETTQLCIGAIQKFYRSGYSVLDVGTGTGILAIAAAKSGPGSIIACDTDTDSVAIARENARLNDVGDRIEFFEGTIDETTGKFDLVLANLTLDVILPILPELLDRTLRSLVLSGILVEQRPMIEAALNDLTSPKPAIEEMGEWISVTVNVA